MKKTTFVALICLLALAGCAKREPKYCMAFPEDLRRFFPETESVEYVCDDGASVTLSCKAHWPEERLMVEPWEYSDCSNGAGFVYTNVRTQRPLFDGSIFMDNYEEGPTFEGDVSVWIPYLGQNKAHGDSVLVLADNAQAPYDSVLIVKDQGLVSFYDPRLDLHWHRADQR